MFRATKFPSSGETTVFMRHLVLVILCGWPSGMQGGMKQLFHSTLQISQSSTQNNKYQVSHKHSCFYWWWAQSCPKHVVIDKHTKNKFCSKLVLFTRLYRDARSKKYKKLLFLSLATCNTNNPFSNPLVYIETLAEYCEIKISLNRP
jgi:hypothetical protein